MGVASELKKGSCFDYSGEVLRVIRKELVAYGTHSHSKLKIYCQPVFGKGEKSVTFMHHDKVDILDIQKKTGQVIAKLPDKLQIMDLRSYETFDGSAEPELIENVNEGDEVIFVDYKGNIRVLEIAHKR